MKEEFLQLKKYLMKKELSVIDELALSRLLSKINKDEALYDFLVPFISQNQDVQNSLYGCFFRSPEKWFHIIVMEWDRVTDDCFHVKKKQQGIAVEPLRSLSSCIKRDFEGLEVLAERAEQLLKISSPTLNKFALEFLYRVYNINRTKYGRFQTAADEYLNSRGQYLKRDFYIKENRRGFISRSYIYGVFMFYGFIFLLLPVLDFYENSLIPLRFLWLIFIGIWMISFVVHNIFFSSHKNRVLMTFMTSLGWGSLVLLLFLFLNSAAPGNDIRTEVFMIKKTGIMRSRGGVKTPYGIIKVDGREKKLDFPRTSLKDYSSVELELQKGFFGYDIIREKRLLSK